MDWETIVVSGGARESGALVAGFVGEEPWYVMGEALSAVVSIYIRRFNRPPNVVELQQIINFTLPDELQNMEITINLKTS